MRRLIVAAAALALASSCGGEAKPLNLPMPREATKISSPPAGNFTLYVSNQSFDRKTVDIEVFVDGVRGANGSFEVKGQHNWIPFGMDLLAGEHRLEVVSETGDARLTKTFTTGDRNWAVVDYWCCGEPDDPKFTFHISDEPLAFG